MIDQVLGLLGQATEKFRASCQNQEQLDRFMQGVQVLQGVALQGPIRAIRKEKIFMGVPRYGPVHWEMAAAVLNYAFKDDRYDVTMRTVSSSLLANCFNRLLCSCVNEKEWDWFMLIHADIVPTVDEWAQKIKAEAEKHGAWCIHGMAPIKNHLGVTSTAIGCADDEWAPVRRVTVRQAFNLPDTWQLSDYLERFPGTVPPNPCLLPNTGCIMFRVDELLRKFALDRAFTIKDKIVEMPRSGELVSRCVPEDWGVGYWCAENGISPWATTVCSITHKGDLDYVMASPWGQWEEDLQYLGNIGEGPPAAS